MHSFFFFFVRFSKASVPPKEKNKKTNIKNSQYKVTREESLGPNAEKHTLKKNKCINLFVYFLAVLGLRCYV